MCWITFAATQTHCHTTTLTRSHQKQHEDTRHFSCFWIMPCFVFGYIQWTVFLCFDFYGPRADHNYCTRNMVGERPFKAKDNHGTRKSELLMDCFVRSDHNWCQLDRGRRRRRLSSKKGNVATKESLDDCLRCLIRWPSIKNDVTTRCRRLPRTNL